MLNGLLIVASAIVICAVIYWHNRPISKRMRLAAPGEFVSLDKGIIHYQWHGNPKGPVLVMVHGLTTPSFVWDEMLPILIESGYRVLTFDHFGRGYSDRPSGNQDLEFFIDEIDALLTELNVTEPFHMVGYSMGGWIAAAYGARRRDKLEKLVLLAPAGLGISLSGVGRLMADWPVLGDILTFCFGGFTVRRGARNGGVEEQINPRVVELQCKETYYSGFTAAVLSSTRNILRTSSEPDHRIMADRDLPLLAIFAGDDDVIPVSGADRLRQINRSADVVVLDGLGHSLAITHGPKVSDLIHEFLAV